MQYNTDHIISRRHSKTCIWCWTGSLVEKELIWHVLQTCRNTIIYSAYNPTEHNTITKFS